MLKIMFRPAPTPPPFVPPTPPIQNKAILAISPLPAGDEDSITLVVRQFPAPASYMFQICHVLPNGIVEQYCIQEYFDDITVGVEYSTSAYKPINVGDDYIIKYFDEDDEIIATYPASIELLNG
jgi:hypothetical protein